MALRPRPPRSLLSSPPAPGSAPLLVYLGRVVEESRRIEAREETFYPFLGTLLEALAVRLGRPGVRATVIPRKTEACLLDLQIRDNDQGIVGYVEAKRLGSDLDRAEDSPQVRKYRETFPNLLLTNFYEIRLFRRGARVGAVRIDLPDGEERLLALFGDFLSFRAPRSLDAASLAEALAGRARVLAERIAERLEREQKGGEVSRLSGFYQAFRQYLLSKLDVRQFADLYAQTIAYGLLAARWEVREGFDRRGAFDDIPLSSGILRDIFRYISVGPIPPEVEWIVDDLVDLLRQASPADFWRPRAIHPSQKRGTDPVLHFYETFLRCYDPKLRKRRGVFYTPLPVVSYIVRSVDLLLRRRLGRPLGLADSGVRLLDPAAGTMTFVVEACGLAAATWRQERGGAAVPALVREHLLPHFFGFELMMAPYAIGHLQMSVALAALGHRPGHGDQGPGQTGRVRLYLTDALHREETAQTPLPYVDALAHESQEADRIKQDERICVVIGNPPWAGHTANPGSHYGSDAEYSRIDGEPLRERNLKWLRDDYVKFLRFAQWKIEQNGEGIVGFVTNHGWLDGTTFRGMRRSLLRTFDEVYVLDLHGNRRRREERSDGSGPDANVFGIEQGVAIVLLVKRRISMEKPLARGVFRADLYGNRTHKLRWLSGRDVESTTWTEVEPQGPSWLFVRGDARIEEEYGRGLPLPRIFDLFSAGLITGRDALVTDVDEKRLQGRVKDFRRELMLRDAGSGRGIDAWRLSPERLRRAREDTGWEERLTTFLFRPFDIRHLFAAEYVLERPREAVLRHLRREGNLALIVPRQHKEEAGALVTSRLAGHKAVSAHDVNYIFPLWREPAGALAGERTPNLTSQVLRLLGDLYGEVPAPEEVLAYIYAVLWTPSYRERYAELLRRDFPRIPFPPERQAFDRLAALGKELIDLHLLRDPRLAESPVRFLGDGEHPLAKRRGARVYRPEERRVLLNEDGLCFDGIEPPVWYFRIGGYQVLDRWLAARAGRRLGVEEIETFQKIVAALERTREVERRLREAWSPLNP